MASSSVHIYRDNDLTVELTVKDTDDAAYDLTGATVTMYIKDRRKEPDAGAAITKAGVLDADPTTGKVTFVFVPANLVGAPELKDGVTYSVDFQVVTSGGKTYTVLRTTFNIINA